ncbi:hypothetical protein KAI32_03720 [Candidatus Pacearchaeota archaeon]|nr:hypothetical protein [Candidatus Pacearchaeota archaeon]
MESQCKKYEDKYINPLVFGTIIEYTSLLTGICAVYKDEKDFIIAIGAGACHLIGKMLQRVGEEANHVERFNRLEKTLELKLRLNDLKDLSGTK